MVVWHAVAAEHAGVLDQAERGVEAGVVLALLHALLAPRARPGQPARALTSSKYILHS